MVVETGGAGLYAHRDDQDVWADWPERFLDGPRKREPIGRIFGLKFWFARPRIPQCSQRGFIATVCTYAIDGPDDRQDS